MKQTIINCPNEKYGYPENYKGRRLSNPDVAHCPVTNKWWVTTLVYIGPVSKEYRNNNPIEYIDCECIKKYE
jgi:hypothetical protein